MRAALQAGEFEELEGGRFRAAGHELGPEEVLVERAGKDGWAVAARRRRHRRARHDVDDELAREGRVYELVHRVNSMRKDAGLDADRPDRAHAPGHRRRPARARGLDRARRRLPIGSSVATPMSRRAAVGLQIDAPARSIRSRPAVQPALRDSARMSSRRSSTGSLNVTSSSTIWNGSMRSTPRARNQSQSRATRCSGADAPEEMPDGADAVEPALVDLRLVVDQVPCHARCPRHVDEPVRVRGVLRAEHEQEVDLGEHLLHSPLAVGRRVTDVFLAWRVDLREAAAQHGDDLRRLVDRKRGLGDVCDPRVGREVERLRLLRRPARGSSPRAPRPSCRRPLRDPHGRSGSRCTRCPHTGVPARGPWSRGAGRVDHVVVAAAPSSHARSGRRRAPSRRRSRPRAPRSPRRRRSRPAPRDRGRHGCCGRSACGRRREPRSCSSAFSTVSTARSTPAQ